MKIGKYFFIFLLTWAECIFAQEALLTEVLKEALPIPEHLPEGHNHLDLLARSKLKIGFIHFRKLIVQAPQNDKIKMKLESEFKDEQKILLNEHAELAEMEKKLLSVEDGTEYQNLEIQIIAKKRDLNQRDNKLRDQYNIRRNEEMLKLQDLIMKEILAFANEKQYDVILNDTGVIFISEKADLTDVIIKRLTEKENQ